MSAPQAIEAAAEARRDASITFLRELIALQPKGEAEVQAHVADALRGLLAPLIQDDRFAIVQGRCAMRASFDTPSGLRVLE